jgi:uncharacterized protein (DUF927 family)
MRWDFIINDQVKKEIRPFIYDHTKKSWINAAFATPRPLYNLQELLTRADVPVLIVEGEKSVEAGKILFPDYVVVTSSLGANAYKGSDWSILTDRTIIIAPDNDDAGNKYAQNIIKLCQSSLKVKSIEILKPEVLGNYIIKDSQIVNRIGDIPVGYDLADAKAEGWTVELIQQAMSDQRFKPFLVQINIPKLIKDELGTNGEIIELGNKRFLLTKTTLYFELLIEKQNDTDLQTTVQQKWIALCGYIKVTRCVKGTNADYGLTVDIITRRGETTEVFIKNKELMSDKVALELLLDKGLRINNIRSKKDLNLIYDYINLSDAKIKAIGIDKVGWHGNCYIMPYIDNKQNSYIINDGQRQNQAEFVLQCNAINPRQLTKKGTLQSWQEHIGKYCQGNSRLVFSICAALTSTILSKLKEEGFCIHYSGASSIGKSTLLYIASSVWGMGKPSSFRTTDNAAESLCKNSNDGLLLIDELQEIEANALDKLVYMFGNGRGKARARRDGEAKEAIHFTILGLSSGEIGIDTKLGEKNKTATAGQNVRFIEINADAGHGMGIFEDIHGFKDAASFAQYFKTVYSAHCGVVIDQFMQLLVKDFEQIKEHIEFNKKQWLEKFVNKNADGQVHRVADKFALIAAVGEIAVEAGILPFAKFDSITASKKLFDNWVEQRGGTGSFELQSVKDRLLSFIQEERNARLLKADGTDNDKNIKNIAGYIKYNSCGMIEEYWLYSEVFNREIIKSRNTRFFYAKLIEDGFIVPDKDNKHIAQKRTPTKESRKRFIIIPASISSDDESSDYE